MINLLSLCLVSVCFFFSSRRRHTRLQGDWSSDVCSSDLSKSESICEACYDKRRNGEVKCTFIGCKRLIENKKWQLCKWHNEDRLALKRLRSEERRVGKERGARG